MHKISLLIFLIFAHTIVWADDICSYSLPQAVHSAYGHRSSLKARRVDIKKFSSLQYAELSGYLPQVNVLTAPWLESKEKLFGKNITIFTASQLIYSFAGPMQQYQIARQNTCLAQVSKDLERDTIRFQTETQFLEWYTVLQRQKSIDLLDRSSRSALERARTAHEVELISTSSWLDSVSNRAQAKALIDSYPHEQLKVKYAVQRAVEELIPDCVDIAATHQYIQRAIALSSQHNTDYYVRKALLCRKELTIKDLEIAREDMLESYYKKSYLPSVSFFSVVVNNGPIPIITQDLNRAIPGFNRFKTFWAFGIGFGWRFDGLGNAARARASAASSCVKVLEKKDLQHEITYQVQEAHQELQQLRYLMEAQEERVKSAQQEFALRKAEFSVDQISEIEFERAQFIWEDEQYKLKNAQVKVAQKYQELMYKSGYPNQCNECVL